MAEVELKPRWRSWLASRKAGMKHEARDKKKDHRTIGHWAIGQDTGHSLHAQTEQSGCAFGLSHWSQSMRVMRLIAEEIGE